MKIRRHRLVDALLMLITIFTASPGLAAEPARLSVAVVEFHVMGDLGTEGGGAIVAEWLISALGASNYYALRERVLLKEVLAEQQLALTGLMDEGEHAAKIGKFYGLDAVISGSVFRWGSTITVTARLIDANSGSIKHTAEIRTGDLDAVPDRINDLARILTGQASQAEIDGNHARTPGPIFFKSRVKLDFGGTAWTEPLTGMEFVLLKGGCYLMGQSEREKKVLLQEYSEQDYAKLYADESPQHEVCVDDFWLARHETTNRQFRLFRPEHDSLDYRGRTMNDDAQPAVYTSWEDARDFAAWLSAKYQDHTFRLPTEAEWEKGCRAGTDTPRFWGWDSDEACRFANVHDRGAEKENHFGWPPHDCDDGFVVTAPVGSLSPNPLGLYDMLGNVWEWTEDVFRQDGYKDHNRVNPVISEGGSTRVRRGGSWNNEDGGIRCANRSDREASRHNNRIGFRLLMQARAPDLEEVDELKKTTLPLVELELVPGKSGYKFKFIVQHPGRYALVLYSPGPAPDVTPDYAGIKLSLVVSDENQELFSRSSPAMARFGAPGKGGGYGAFFASFLVPNDLPSGKKLTAEVKLAGGMDDFLAHQGLSRLVLIRAAE